MLSDVVIVGGGAAGLSAAIFSSRRALRTTVISQDIGGQAATTEEIENYPGIAFTGGPALALAMKAQSEKFGARFVFERAERLEAVRLEDGTDGYRVTTDRGTHDTRTLILAYGLSHKHLGVPGEKEFAGQGVSYCATCDAPLFKGRRTAVIGGGNSALDAALLLSKFCPSVTLIHRGLKFSGEAVVIEQVNRAPNIDRIINTVVSEIRGTRRVESIALADVADPAKTKTLPVDGVFVEIGFQVNPKLVEGFVDLDARKQIIITPACETSRPGVFAAGDITTILYKQIVISAGEGAKAGLQVYKYLQSKGIATAPFSTDWGRTSKNLTHRL